MLCVEKRLVALGKYMQDAGFELYYTPWYTYVLAVPDSYNARHTNCILSIEADDLADGNWEKIRDAFRRKAGQICGFYPELRSTIAVEFVGEMLFGDFVPTGEMGSYDEQSTEVVKDGRFRHFNASMVYDIVRFIKCETDSDFDDLDVQNLMSAPCFLNNIRAEWSAEESIREIINDLYWEDCLKRDD